MREKKKKIKDGGEPRKHNLSYQMKFSTATTLGAIVVAMLSFFIAIELNYGVGNFLGIPMWLRILIISVILGAIGSFFLTRYFVAPLTKLCEAMEKVSAGDFTVKLDTEATMKDVQATYNKFNQMVEALEKTETIQTDFISNVSHEFKTPINAIEGYATLLQDPQATPEQQDSYLDKIIFNTKRLSELVGNILLLSKIYNETATPQSEMFRLDEQVRQSIFALESKWSAKDVAFDIEMDEVQIRGYRSLYSHVWINLIDNAIKFNPYGGEIKIRLKESGDTVSFAIQDSGPGISEEDQKFVFDKFYQSETSHKNEGNGLGLALVKKIVVGSGGNVKIESEEGMGAKFIVTLPKDVDAL